jgi:hypothetical protein
MLHRGWQHSWSRLLLSGQQGEQALKQGIPTVAGQVREGDGSLADSYRKLGMVLCCVCSEHFLAYMGRNKANNRE